MEGLDLALRVSVVIFMVGSLAGVGLGLSPRAALAPLADARFVALSLLLGWAAGPAIAWLLLQIVPLEGPYATGLLLLALAPGAPFAPTMARIARGDPAYVAAFMLLGAAATVVLMPLGVPLLLPGLVVHPWAIARPLLLFVLAPLIAGTVMRGVRAEAAGRAQRSVAATANAAGGAALLLVAVLHGGNMLDAVGSDAIAIQALFLGAMTVTAHAAAAGLPDARRRALTIGLCTRNLGAALAPLAAIDPDPRAMVMIVIGIPMTLAASWLAARWLARRPSSRTPAARAALI